MSASKDVNASDSDGEYPSVSAHTFFEQELDSEKTTCLALRRL